MAEGAVSPARRSLPGKPEQDKPKEQGSSSKIHLDVAAVGVGLRFLELDAASQVPTWPCELNNYPEWE